MTTPDLYARSLWFAKQMSQKAADWFAVAGDCVIYAGKLAASLVATATVLYPLAGTYFKVQALQEQQGVMNRKLDELLEASKRSK